jgi:single-stranded-DNA-specific exonuclease
MSLGIECLLAPDEDQARALALRLDELNRERRAIEGEMQASTLAMNVEAEAANRFSISLHSPDWHTGIVGLLASRLKDRYHRPVFAFAAEPDGRLKGSGRSVPALHLRDALDLAHKRNPGLIERFGGHAMAAGLTLGTGTLERFRDAFEEVARERLTPADLAERIETDGELAGEDLSAEFAAALRAHVWGQGFPEPRFHGRFRVEAQRVVGEKHLKLTLNGGGRRVSAIRFGSCDPLPGQVHAVFRLELNEYQGTRSLELVLEHCEP